MIEGYKDEIYIALFLSFIHFTYLTSIRNDSFFDIKTTSHFHKSVSIFFFNIFLIN